jgi:hypothetical protein
MMNYKGVLTWGIEVVTFLFAAFGGFLTKIAPPDQTGASFAVGALSFLILIVLLVVTALGRQAPGNRYRKRWLAAGVILLLAALPAAYLYSEALNLYTYWYPPERPAERHVKGGDEYFTELAEEWAHANPTETSAGELERNLPYDQIWKPEGIAASNRRLLLTYAWLVLSIAAGVFGLIEANSPTVKRARKQQP